MELYSRQAGKCRGHGNFQEQVWSKKEWALFNDTEYIII